MTGTSQSRQTPLSPGLTAGSGLKPITFADVEAGTWAFSRPERRERIETDYEVLDDVGGDRTFSRPERRERIETSRSADAERKRKGKFFRPERRGGLDARLRPDAVMAARLASTAATRCRHGLGERLEKLKEQHEQGLIDSLEFLKNLLQMARETRGRE